MCVTTCYSEVESLFNIKGQAGYNMGKFLPYFTAGVAIGKVQAGTRVPLVADGIDLGKSDVNVGWMYGFGIDASIQDNLSVRFEYNQTDLGDLDYFIPAQGQIGTVPFEDIDTFKVGVSYHY